MRDALPDGIPSEREYRAMLKSDLFKNLETFADNFALHNKEYLRSFAYRWGKDSLHHWSRQWEYPYVYRALDGLVQQNSNAKILDAGSGVTFFPYYLKKRFPAAEVSCCDYDEKLAESFDKINAESDVSVEFSVSDLKTLSYKDEEFQAVYCISVLEHTNDYEEVIKEFSRILQPNGKLIVTFDISLDGTRDINLDDGCALLKSLAQRFDVDADISFDLHSQASNPDIFTTLTANEIDANLLPWRFPPLLHRLKSLFRTGRLGSWPPPLTVFCLSLTKRSDSARE